MPKYIPYVISGSVVTILFEGKNIPVSTAHPKYDEVLKMVKEGDADALRLFLTPKQAVVESAAGAAKGRVTLVDGELLFDGEPMAGSNVSRILSYQRDGHDIQPYLNYEANKAENPSFRARKELDGFVEACRLPVTQDGHILAYKVVAPDFTDLYTRKMDNSVGAIVEMDRREVDDDCNRTCSDGLHFASLEYILKGNYGTGYQGANHLVIVKINPRDVVSIPTDYNNSKGRACRYEILEEVEWGTRIEVDTFGYDTDSEEREEEEYEEEYEEEEEQDDTTATDTDADDEAAAAAPPAPVKRPAGRKLDKADVKRFLKLLEKDGITLTAACKIMNISRRQGARIRDGENWTDVTGR